MEWYKVAFGDIYPLVYPHRDDEEASRVAQSLAPLLGGRSPLIDVACGNGRYMAAFARTGLDVYGVDLSPYLLSDAVASRSLRGRVVLGDMRALPFRDGAAAAVVNMFTSFGYFETDLDNVRVMHEAARIVATGGVFLMDFLNAGALDRELRDARPSVRHERGATVEERREIVDGGRVLVKHVRVGRRGARTDRVPRTPAAVPTRRLGRDGGGGRSLRARGVRRLRFGSVRGVDVVARHHAVRKNGSSVVSGDAGRHSNRTLAGYIGVIPGLRGARR